MTIKVRATAAGFLGCLRVAGDEFHIANEEAFAESWMERLDGKEAKKAAAPAGNNEDPARFVAGHVAAGNYAVKDTSNGQRASKLYKKADGDARALAEAEAQRLNDGGEIDVEASRPAPETPAKPPESGGGNNLPDA